MNRQLKVICHQGISGGCQFPSSFSWKDGDGQEAMGSYGDRVDSKNPECDTWVKEYFNLTIFFRRQDVKMMSSNGTAEPSTRLGHGYSSYIKRKKSSLQDVRILVIGPPGVGKSAVTVRFLTKRFIGEYDHSAEVKYKHNVIIDQDSVVFEILDTCSSVKDPNSEDNTLEDNLKWADGVMLVYSITSVKSFQAASELAKQIQEIRRSTYMIPMIMVGNKCDLTHVRQVTRTEGDKLAADCGCLFTEVSASEDSTVVTEAFLDLYREIQASKRRSRNFFDKLFSLGSSQK